MRPRTPTILWIPFVFSIGTISWGLLFAGLAILAAVVIAPAMADVRQAEGVRNDYQATLDLLDQKIALQRDFLAAATKDPVLMERLASRQLNLNRKDQEILLLDPALLTADRSVENLIKESLIPVTPKPVATLNPVLAQVLKPGMRPLAIMAACAALALSFFLGVKYERTHHV